MSKFAATFGEGTVAQSVHTDPALRIFGNLLKFGGLGLAGVAAVVGGAPLAVALGATAYVIGSMAKAESTKNVAVDGSRVKQENYAGKVLKSMFSLKP